MNKDFIYGTTEEAYDSLINKTNDHIKIIPIVDKDFKVIDYFEFEKNIYFPVAIPNLAGNEFNYLIDAFLSSRITSYNVCYTKLLRIT